MSEDKNKEEELEFVWKQRAQLGNFDSLKPIINAMILLIEEEKKNTLDKIERAKKNLEIVRMKDKR